MFKDHDQILQCTDKPEEILKSAFDNVTELHIQDMDSNYYH